MALYKIMSSKQLKGRETISHTNLFHFEKVLNDFRKMEIRCNGMLQKNKTLKRSRRDTKNAY